MNELNNLFELPERAKITHLGNPKRAPKQEDNFNQIIRNLKKDKLEFAIFSFAGGVVSSLSGHIQTVSNDLKKCFCEIADESMKRDIREEIEAQVSELKLLLNLLA